MHTYIVTYKHTYVLIINLQTNTFDLNIHTHKHTQT